MRATKVSLVKNELTSKKNNNGVKAIEAKEIKK